MENIRNTICDIISIMIPDEEEIKNYRLRSDDIKLADALLDLVVSNLIFKVLVLKNSLCKEGCNNKCGIIIERIKTICEDRNLQKEWKILSQLHIEHNLEKEELNASVAKYVKFEFEHFGQALSEEETWEQGDNEELIYSYLDTVCASQSTLEREENSLRFLLEAILILNTHILEEERFKQLINDYETILKGQLSLQNF